LRIDVMTAIKHAAVEGYKHMTSIGILGAAGRMGRAVAEAATAADLTVAGGVDTDGAVDGPYGDAAALAAHSDVLIDFSAPAALPTHLAAARAAKTPIVIGTTGLQPGDHGLIDQAATEIAVLQTGNMSLGVNLLARLVREAAARLGPEWDIEVLEMHHRFKVDAPSGTALLLGSAAAEGRGSSPKALSRYDRMTGKPLRRETGTIGYASLRGGSVAGDHMVVFAGEHERLELGHRAESRAIFAQGAVKAARWLVAQPAGRYTMADVLGL
jgi:4-hydroxy-tetrahydrodipicolinate reductase